MSAAAAQTDDAFAPFHHDTERPQVLRLDGEINVRTPFMFGAALRAHPGVTTLELHSPGGDVYQALGMVDAIRGAGLATRIAPDDRCHSACSFLFFAGVERRAEGGLGVHQLDAPNQQSAQYVMNDVLDALIRLDVPDAVRRRMFQTPADQMYVFSPAELDAFGFGGTRVVAAAQPPVADETGAPGITETDAETDAETSAAAAEPEPTPAVAATAVAVERDDAPSAVIRVKPDGSGDFASIADAVRTAPEGARILVYPGTYTGHVTVRSSVDIVGTGAREDIVWETTWPSILRWDAPGGSLSGMTLRPAGSEAQTHQEAALIEIRRGAPAIRDVDVSGLAEAKAVIRVSGPATDPVIEGNRITGGRMGIMFDGGRGTAAENLIQRAEFGIGIVRGAPVVRANQIRNVEIGIGLARAARGEVVGNEVRYCARGLVLRGAPTTELGDNRVGTCATPVARE